MGKSETDVVSWIVQVLAPAYISSFGRGYFTNWVISMDEWNEALARARGEKDVHLEKFSSLLKLAPPPYDLVTNQSPRNK
jgi:hypothetical protein